jgi:hypothetical protein
VTAPPLHGLRFLNGRKPLREPATASDLTPQRAAGSVCSSRSKARISPNGRANVWENAKSSGFPRPVPTVETFYVGLDPDGVERLKSNASRKLRSVSRIATLSEMEHISTHTENQEKRLGRKCIMPVPIVVLVPVTYRVPTTMFCAHDFLVPCPTDLQRKGTTLRKANKDELEIFSRLRRSVPSSSPPSIQWVQRC